MSDYPRTQAAFDAAIQLQREGGTGAIPGLAAEMRVLEQDLAAAQARLSEYEGIEEVLKATQMAHAAEITKNDIMEARLAEVEREYHDASPCKFTNPHYPSLCTVHTTQDHTAQCCYERYDQLMSYITLLEQGLSSHEARETVWGSLCVTE